MNLFASLELGRRALFASRLSLDVAGDNIANVNTPGYTRRRVELTEASPVYLGRLFVGQGVDVHRVTRLSDRLLEAQVRSESEAAGREGSASDALSRIEGLLSETGGGAGISSALSDLFGAFSGLAAHAEDPSLRRDVASKADALATVVRRQAKGLQDLRAQTDASVTGTLARVTALSKDIAELNRRIQVEGSGEGEALSLRDARAGKLQELSSLVDIHVAEGTGGSVFVQLAATGDTLVNENKANELTVTRDSSGLARIQANRGGTLVDVTDRIRGGRIGGLLRVRDGNAVSDLADLDALAADLIDRFNALHTAGVDASGAPGGAFFASTPPGLSAAANLAVSATILADPNRIAAGTTASPGDGANALAIAGLESQVSAALGGRTSAGALAALQTKVGLDAGASSSALGTAQAALLAAQNRLEALSGVDLDEEATALLQYQRSYEAAARFIATVNDMTKVALGLGAS